MERIKQRKFLESNMLVRKKNRLLNVTLCKPLNLYSELTSGIDLRLLPFPEGLLCST